MVDAEPTYNFIDLTGLFFSWMVHPEPTSHFIDLTGPFFQTLGDRSRAYLSFHRPHWAFFSDPGWSMQSLPIISSTSLDFFSWMVDAEPTHISISTKLVLDGRYQAKLDSQSTPQEEKYSILFKKKNKQLFSWVFVV